MIEQLSEQVSERYEMLKKSCELFPAVEYLDPRDVAHARKQHMKCVDYLRSRGNYLMDKYVPRMQ